MANDKVQNLIDYIVKNTDLNQADIAKNLKVSRAQVSKWKAGDYISSDREKQLLKLAGLFDTPHVEWAMFAKTKKNAQAWCDYVVEIFNDIEWGYSLDDYFNSEPDLYVGAIITNLCDLGANIEQQAPTAIWINEYEMTPLASALYSILDTWGQLRVWIENVQDFGYIEHLDYDASSRLFDIASDLEWLSFDLALEDVETSRLLAIGVKETELDAKLKESRSMINSHLHEICQIRTEHGLPITDNYFQLLYLAPIDLAEQTWFRSRYPADCVDEDTIKPYLPYGEQLILSHLKNNAIGIEYLNKKLDRIISMLSKDGDAPKNKGEEFNERS